MDVGRRQSSLAVIATGTSREGSTMFNCLHQQDAIEIEEITLEELLRDDSDSAGSGSVPPWLPDIAKSNASWKLIKDNVFGDVEDRKKKETDGEEGKCDQWVLLFIFII